MRLLQAIFYFFYEILLGCRHDRLTRPFTIQQQTYKVCLDCGKQVYYSADTMRPLRARELRRMQAIHASELKVLSAAGPVKTLRSENGSKAVA
jgi:hypothetical protein